MQGTIFAVVGLIIGAMILGTGLYYLLREKDNAESRKIYGIACLVGLAIVTGILIKIAVAGL